MTTPIAAELNPIPVTQFLYVPEKGNFSRNAVDSTPEAIAAPWWAKAKAGELTVHQLIVTLEPLNLRRMDKIKHFDVMAFNTAVEYPEAALPAETAASNAEAGRRTGLTSKLFGLFSRSPDPFAARKQQEAEITEDAVRAMCADRQLRVNYISYSGPVSPKVIESHASRSKPDKG
jgi:hypothetical protein